jgi:hypothetical protein
MVWEAVDWINLASVADRFENANEHASAIRGGEFSNSLMLASQEGICSIELITNAR